MSFDAKINLWRASVTVAPSPASSGTSMTVDDASRLPAAPFNLVISPADTEPTYDVSEIVRCTNVAGNVLTISRAQESTTARAVIVGDVVRLGPTLKWFTDLEAGIVQHGDAAKSTPVDADELGLLDSAASWVKKTLTWANVKATLKTYFDAIYAAVGHNHDGVYSATGHNHDGVYAPASHDHDGHYAPLTHASQHQNGGSDEIATATPAANAIPKADAGGKLDGWITDASTGAKGKVQLATDGESAAGKACQANDARLTNARTPTAHASSHASGGSDAVKLDDLAAPDDNTDLDANTARHGLLAKTVMASKKLASTELGAQSWEDDIGVLGVTIDGGGAAITTGEKACFSVPWDCEILEWTIVADQSGSISIDVWSDAPSGLPLSAADSMPGASYVPTLTSARVATGATTEWDRTGLAKDNVVAFSADDVVNVTRVTMTLRVRKLY